MPPAAARQRWDLQGDNRLSSLSLDLTLLTPLERRRGLPCSEDLPG